MIDISYTNNNVLGAKKLKRVRTYLRDFKQLYKSVKKRSLKKLQGNKQFSLLIADSFSGPANFEREFDAVKAKLTKWIVLVFDAKQLQLEILAVNSDTDLTKHQTPIMVVPNDDHHSSQELFNLIDWDVVEINYCNVIKFQ